MEAGTKIPAMQRVPDRFPPLSLQQEPSADRAVIGGAPSPSFKEFIGDPARFASGQAGSIIHCGNLPAIDGLFGIFAFGISK